jgi:hypothetical protein
MVKGSVALALFVLVTKTIKVQNVFLWALTLKKYTLVTLMQTDKKAGMRV